MEIRTVLCPIDFTVASEPEVDLAVRICRAFAARLVVHHNLAAISPGFARAWDWDASHQRGPDSMPEAERRLKTVLDRVPGDVAREAIASRGDSGFHVR